MSTGSNALWSLPGCLKISFLSLSIEALTASKGIMILLPSLLKLLEILDKRKDFFSTACLIKLKILGIQLLIKAIDSSQTSRISKVTPLSTFR